MKFNNAMFNLSQDYYKDIQNSKTTSLDKRLQNKLLKVLLKRFKNELKENSHTGIIKVKFKSPFWQDPEDGYDLIRMLITIDKFDNFASEYCIYLGNSEDRCDEMHTAYYEIIWDYRTYFENMNTKELKKWGC